MTALSIKDPIHGIIELDSVESKIIDTADFQRLRRIRQLATAHLVYPGANHTRFEHSLGTLHLTSQICTALKLEKEIAAKVRLYALLHDIGHVAFSHEGEQILSRVLGDHEKIGREKIPKGEIGDIIAENYNPHEIADFSKSPYSTLVSSDIGADRMDYLKRDSYYTGVAYGIIDEERIISKMFFSGGMLGVEEGALEASESLLIARFMMFSTVYLHHTVRIASAMLARAISAALENGMDPKLFLSHGDAEILVELLKIKDAKPYAKALIERKLYKRVYEVQAASLSTLNIEKIEKKIAAKAGCDVINDKPPNFLKLEGFKIRMDDGGMQEIGEISELVRALKSAEESRKRVMVLAPAAYKEKVKRICSSYFS